MKTTLMASAVAVMMGGLMSLGAADWKAPRTAWGEPDLEGTWTSQSELGVPFERPAEFGTRDRLTDEEFAQREAQARNQLKSDNADFDPEAADTSRAGQVGSATSPPPTWLERGKASRRTSIVIDPPNGRLPEISPAGVLRLRAAGRGALDNGPFNGPEDMGLYQRCITRGVPNAIFPAVYNANTRIVQGQGFVAVTYEMIHETRVIPTTPRRICRPMSVGTGRLAGTLGRRYARCRRHQLQLEGRLLRIRRRLHLVRTLQADTATADCVRGDGRGSGYLVPSLDRCARLAAAAGRHVRVRLPRGQLRDEEHAHRVACRRRAVGLRQIRPTSLPAPRARPPFLARLVAIMAGRSGSTAATTATKDAKKTIDMFRALLSERAEVSGRRLAVEALVTYSRLQGEALEHFLELLAQTFAPDERRIAGAIDAYRAQPGDATLAELQMAVESPRLELFRRLNVAPMATGALIDLRRKVRDTLQEHPDRAASTTIWRTCSVRGSTADFSCSGRSTGIPRRPSSKSSSRTKPFIRSGTGTTSGGGCRRIGDATPSFTRRCQTSRSSSSKSR